MSRKRSAPVQPHQAAGAIIKELERVSVGWGASKVFDDWLEMTEASLYMLPYHAASVAARNGYAEDPAPIKALWARLLEEYDRDAWQRLHQAFQILLASGGDSAHDIVGEVFMLYGYPNEHTGQFFTPVDVARAAVRMTISPEEVERDIRDRLRRAILSAPGGDVLHMLLHLAQLRGEPEGLAFFLQTVAPAIDGRFEPYKIQDPACGSAVMLVCALEMLPAWMVAYGLVEFHGYDIDARCVRMAHINLMLHGAAAFVLLHRNSLSDAPDYTPPRLGRVRWSPVTTPPELEEQKEAPPPSRTVLPTLTKENVSQMAFDL